MTAIVTWTGQSGVVQKSLLFHRESPHDVISESFVLGSWFSGLYASYWYKNQFVDNGY